MRVPVRACVSTAASRDATVRNEFGMTGRVCPSPSLCLRQHDAVDDVDHSVRLHHVRLGDMRHAALLVGQHHGVFGDALRITNDPDASGSRVPAAQGAP